MIREAKTSDKNSVLKFCKNTFSWGDYIDQVWDSWLSEGNLLVFEEKEPIGICHAFYSDDQIWIEGIRVDPIFRRQKIASKLVNYAEKIGKEKEISSSFMLIDTQNHSSLQMAISLNYDVFQTWNFYSLIPRKISNYEVDFVNSKDLQLENYVRSWRWLPLNANTLSSLIKNKKIVKATINGNDSIAILCDSDHFDKTLIVTLYSSSDNATKQILLFLQSFGWKNNYERIQILSKESLPVFDSLEHRISFHLMKKSLT